MEADYKQQREALQARLARAEQSYKENLERVVKLKAKADALEKECEEKDRYSGTNIKGRAYKTQTGYYIAINFARFYFESKFTNNDGTRSLVSRPSLSGGCWSLHRRYTDPDSERGSNR